MQRKKPFLRRSRYESFQKTPAKKPADPDFFLAYLAVALLVTAFFLYFLPLYFKILIARESKPRGLKRSFFPARKQPWKI